MGPVVPAAGPGLGREYDGAQPRGQEDELDPVPPYSQQRGESLSTKAGVPWTSPQTSCSEAVQVVLQQFEAS